MKNIYFHESVTYQLHSIENLVNCPMIYIDDIAYLLCLIWYDCSYHLYYTESRPDIRRLQRIASIEGRVIEVADRVTHHWERLAQVLRLERSVTKQVKRREKTLQGACIAVLQHWLVGKGRRPVSWETLMNSLKEMGQRDLYEELILVRREGIRLDDGRIVIYF